MFYQTLASMNTRLSMVLPALDAVAGEPLARDAQGLLRSLESMMSRFDGHGELATVNRRAAHGPVRLSQGLWDVIDACVRHHRLTEGAFDIAQGARGAGHGMHLLDLDPSAHTVRFMAPGLQLDLGGIGKGIALDLLARHLRGRQVEQAFLSFGESSVAVIGSHPAGACWPVGVEHLFQPGTALHRFDLRDSAMSTSGNRGGQAHIIDPANGQPATGCRTVSVACASAADAEALSTALFVLPAARRADVLARYPAASAVAFAYAAHDGDRAVERTWHHAEQPS
jgi:thiamine biosynthesis lipoprotein